VFVLLPGESKSVTFTMKPAPGCNGNGDPSVATSCSVIYSDLDLVKALKKQIKLRSYNDMLNYA